LGTGLFHEIPRVDLGADMENELGELHGALSQLHSTILGL
jgi:hypothetical protein